ncbi:hypothetical protein E3N88_12270 [Mikania micrantha]|uniref:Uncharacterized protein n=1 Tax=Mikania micrantha TaxID=192012 RepID=A0A5N6P6T9_9ASTR|nr:hypothetical protein E3N88_12270 [Mikania micrantha]
MRNVGENRVQNGVLDCPKSKNEEKFLSVGRLDSSRYAMEVGLRVLRGTRCMQNILDSSGNLRGTRSPIGFPPRRFYSSSSRINSTHQTKTRPNHHQITILKPSEAIDRTRDHLYKL